MKQNIAASVSLLLRVRGIRLEAAERELSKIQHHMRELRRVSANVEAATLDQRENMYVATRNLMRDANGGEGLAAGGMERAGHIAQLRQLNDLGLRIDTALSKADEHLATTRAKLVSTDRKLLKTRYLQERLQVERRAAEGFRAADALEEANASLRLYRE